MKRNLKLLASLAALLMALALLFSSCTPSEGGETSDSEAIADTTAAPDTGTADAGTSDHTLVSGGVGKYKIIRPANLDTTDISVRAAIDIRKAIADASGVSLELGDDWIRRGEEHNSESFEILVGYTGYPETAEVMSSINYGEYAIRAVGNKIVIFSYTDTGYVKAMNTFNALVRESASEEADGSKTVTLSKDKLDLVNISEAKVATLPIYEGGTFSAVCDMGDNCYGVIIEDTTTDEYNAYLAKLAQDSYKTHATNDIAGSLFATLYTEEYTVNAGYYNNMDEVRIIIEPYRDCTLAPLKDESAPVVTTSQVTMLGVEGISGGEYQQNGLCMIYRLSTGEFIIIDGGHHGNSAIYAANIIKELRAQSKDYAKSDADITIASWIITHPHTDHHGTLLNEYKQFTKFNFESIMCNFWAEADFNEAKSTTSSFAVGTFAGYYKCNAIAKELGIDFISPHVGQVFWYGDTAFEFLYTIESYLPKVAKGFNTCSLVFRTITADASGKTTSVMVTGDATGHALAVCNKQYKTDLLCDVVQVAHHGGGTGGANNDVQAAYTLMKPSVIFWPVGANYFPNVADNTYNHALLEGKNPNFAELYVAGWQGNAVTLPLPYTLGTAITNNIVEPKK